VRPEHDTIAGGCVPPACFLWRRTPMSKKVCVFVDGENFRHSIIDLFERFNSYDYLPKTADWDALFDWFVSKAVPESERVRTYWYVIELLDFFPYKFPNADTDSEKLLKVLNKDEWAKSKLATLEGEALTQEMKRIVEELRHRQRYMRSRFEGWRSLQDSISSRWSRIEWAGRSDNLQPVQKETGLGKGRRRKARYRSDRAARYLRHSSYCLR